MPAGYAATPALRKHDKSLIHHMPATAPSTPPTNLRVTFADTYDIYVAWDAPSVSNGELTGYIIDIDVEVGGLYCYQLLHYSRSV